MSDTRTHAAPVAPVAKTEGDGVSYRGLGWFIIVLAGTTLLCQALMVGFFKFMERSVASADVAPAALAEPRTLPRIEDNQVVAQRPIPAPNLLVNEPSNLEQFRASEDQSLSSYGVIDPNAGTYRIPIDRAMKLIVERGVPGGQPLPAGATPPKTEIKK